MDWEDAYKKLETVIEAYEEIGPVGLFALVNLHGLRARYLCGERTEDLYAEIMEAYETC